jgi:16S rRNA pseudouridine516 synthase
MRKMRLDRLLSRNGSSRKEAAALVKAGRVTVDGRAVGDPSMQIDLDSARVCLDGVPLRTSKHIHLMMNKPAGVLTATQDPHGQATVADYLPKNFAALDIGPVGRLDKDVTGLVIMTTDGQLAHRLISPRWEQDKIYVAHVEGRLTDADVTRMAEGIALKDFTCAPAKLEIIRAGGEESLCEVTVHEGKYHQVKRMLGALGHPVTALHRRSIAGIELDTALAEGQWRELTDAEKAHLYNVTDLEE